MREARLVWQEGLRFEAQTPSGQRMIVESPTGPESGYGPMDMVLVALAGCTAIDVVMILEKQRQQFTGLEVVVRAERAPDPPRVYTGFEMTYTIRGHDLNRAAVERAVKLSEEKYCSVGVMLSQTAPLHHTVVLEDAAARGE